MPPADRLGRIIGVGSTCKVASPSDSDILVSVAVMESAHFSVDSWVEKYQGIR